MTVEVRDGTDLNFDDRYRPDRSGPAGLAVTIVLPATDWSEIQTGTGSAGRRYRFHLWLR